MLSLVLGDRTFTVSKYLFAGVSGLLYRDRKALDSGRFEVRESYPPEIFQLFCDACENKPFLLTEENCFELRRIAQDFQVSSLVDRVSQYIEGEADKAIVLLQQWRFNLSHGIDNTETESGLASNLDRLLDLPEFIELPSDALERIVNNPNVRLTNVHKLVEAALLSKERGKNPRGFFQNGLFSKISAPELRDLVGNGIVPESLDGNAVIGFTLELQGAIAAADEQIAELSAQVRSLEGVVPSGDTAIVARAESAAREARSRIAALEERLRSGPSTVPHERSPDTQEIEKRIAAGELAVRIARAKARPLDGIFAQLTRECNGNPIALEIVEVTTPTRPTDDFPIANIIEFSPQMLGLTYYHHAGQDAASNWFQFDFARVATGVSIWGYTLRTNGLGENFANPVTWDLLGSSDGEQWSTLHRVVGFGEFSNDRRTVVFVLQAQAAPVRMIRFLQLASAPPFRDHAAVIALSAFELHGSLVR